MCRSPLIYFLCPKSRRFEHRSQRPFFSFRLFMMSTGRGSFVLEDFVRQISVQSARIIVPASSRMLVGNSLPGLCLHDNSLLHKWGGEPLERVPYLEIRARTPLERTTLCSGAYSQPPATVASFKSKLWRSRTRRLSHRFHSCDGWFRRCCEHIRPRH